MACRPRGNHERSAWPAGPEAIMSEQLRDEVRTWLVAHLPKPWVDAVEAGDDAAVFEAAKGFDQRAFLRELGQAGYAQPTWEKAHGGLGLSAEEAGVVEEEKN